MTEGGQDFDLGQVVGSAGEKGDDGSTVWNTSTAPTYANSKYTFTISNLSGKTGLQIAVNDIIFYSTYYYIVSAVNTTTVDCSTRVSIKGSDASVTIVDNLTSTSSTSALSAKQGKVLNDNKIETSSIATSFGSTPSDSKVASEKLVKDSLDAKQATLVSGTNIKTVNNNSLLGSGNINIESGSDVDIVTSWSATLSDSKVPSEKLTKNSLDAKAPTSHASSSSTYGLGTTANYGHVKTINGLTQSSHSDGTALSAYQGKVLKDAIDAKPDSSDIPTKTSDLTNDSNYISTSSTTGLVKNDGSIMTGGTGSSNWAIGNHSHSGYVSGSKVTSWSGTVSDSNIPSEKLVKDTLDGKQATLVSGTNIKTVNNESLLGSGNITIQGGSSVDVVTSWEATLSDSKVPSEKLVKNTIDGLSIPTKTSDLTNDGADGTNVFVANNDSRLSDSRTPTSHTHGNLTNDGKVGSNANYIVVTGTGGAITSVQKLGNITYDGKIGSTSGKPVITTTSGTVTTGSFGSTSGTFAEGNHTHSNYISTSSTTGLIKNDGSIMTSGTGSTNYAAGNHTHSGYISTSSTTGLVKNDGSIMTSGTGSTNYAAGNHTHSGYVSTSDIADNLTTNDSTKVLSAKQGKALNDLIGAAITYINQ